MVGCVIDATPIAVDYWRPTKAPQARLFFLTHLHADHTEGLTSTWRLPIYTSTVTAQLLKRKFKLPNSIVRELEVGQSYLIPLDEGNNITITVTVLDANHVPGAVMFLFQGYFGNILYCGDMRWSPDMLEDPVLRDVVLQRELDVLYMDNTYSAPYCKFPTREEATQHICKIIDTYPDHEIKIGINSLGREKLLEDIAQRFGERILVSQDKYEQLELLGSLDVFTTDPEQSRIHAVPLKQMQIAAHKKWNEKYQTISIIPSALYVGWKNGPYSSQASNGMHVVPYSDHSSYSELMDMVSQLAPHQIIPTVTYWSTSGFWADPSAPNQTVKADMTVYRHLLSLPPPDPVVVPEDIIKIMDSKAPRVFQTQARRCVLRRGLSPRRSKIRGVVYSSLKSPRSHSLRSMSYTPSGTPTSFTTLESSRSDLLTPGQASFKESPRTLKHGGKYTFYGATHNIKQFQGSISEKQGSEVPNEMQLRIDTPTPTSDPHKSTGAVTEEGKRTGSSTGNRSTTHGKQRLESHTESSAKRQLSLESPKKGPSSKRVNLKKKRKSQKVIGRDAVLLLREISDFVTPKIGEMDSRSTCSAEEMHVMMQDAKLVLKSLSCLHSLM